MKGMIRFAVLVGFFMGSVGMAQRNAPVDVPEYWLAYYGLTNDFAAEVVADADSDSFFTWEEYLHGSDPTNSASYFRITRNTVEEGVLMVEWDPSVPGRVYTPVLTDLPGGTNWPLPSVNGPVNGSTNYIGDATGTLVIDVDFR